MIKFTITEDKIDLIATTLDDFGWCSGYKECEGPCTKCIKDSLLMPMVREYTEECKCTGGEK